MTEKNRERYGYRSLFWPIVLIGIGVIALLANMGALDRENLLVLFRLWPLLLILIGIDIMFGRRAPGIGALIGIGGTAAVLGAVALGRWHGAADIVHGSRHLPSHGGGLPGREACVCGKANGQLGSAVSRADTHGQGVPTGAYGCLLYALPSTDHPSEGIA